jgi:hypothetical protein
MLYSEIIAVCSEIHTKHINTLSGQNVEFLSIKTSGTYSNHMTLSCHESFNNSIFRVSLIKTTQHDCHSKQCSTVGACISCIHWVR